jgi:FkbM family methyltransferase
MGNGEIMYEGHVDQRWGCTTYSQHGEDLMILNLFDLMGIQKPNYLDIGAHHPVTISNTALLYSRGSRGVNVEANPHLIEAFKRERPDEQTLNLGVAAKPGRRLFQIHHPDAAMNTFDQKQVEVLEAAGHPTIEKVEVEVVTIDDLIIKYFDRSWPDLLSLDAEGLDYEILESATLVIPPKIVGTVKEPTRYIGPRIICVEARFEDSAKMKNFLVNRGYSCICRMHMNLIFVRRDYLNLVLR